MKKGKNKNDKVCGIMKTEKGARNLDKKNFQIQYNSRLCLQGCILVALGILGPTLIAEQRLGIYDDLTMAMMYECSGALISAALKLVCMNVVLKPSGEHASSGSRNLHSVIWRSILFWCFFCTGCTVCAGILKYAHRIYGCSTVLYRFLRRYDAADGTGRTFCSTGNRC